MDQESASLRSVPDEKMNWYALHVRSRHEHLVSRQLQAGEIEQFLPLVERLRYWKDRKKLVSFPLFPGYLFVRMVKEPTSLVKVLKMPGVVRFLGIGQGLPVPVPEEQVDSLRMLAASGCCLDPYPYIREGQQVIIRRGPLAGATGRLISKNRHHLFVIAVDILKQAVAVKIDAASVEPL